MPGSSEFLAEFGDKTLGLHLHDVKGLEDHFAPFTGEVDWSELLKAAPKEALMVIEAHSKVSQRELEKSFTRLPEVLQKAGVK